MGLVNYLFPKNNQQFKKGDANLTLAYHYTSMGALVGHFLFIFMFLWLGVKELAWLNIGSCSIYLFCNWINRRGDTRIALLLSVFEVSVHSILAVLLVGRESNFQYYFLVLIPLIYFSQIWRTRLKIVLGTAISWLFFSLNYYSLAVPPLNVIDATRIQFIGAVNIGILFAFFSILSYFYYLAATNAEIALTNANLGLKIQARNDALTQLPNRRELTERIELLASLYLTKSDPFCVIMADIDDFKIHNDTYGHNMGDVILVKVAEALRNCMREQDMVGRWGGEEFLALLPGTSILGGQALAERMRVKIASMYIVSGGIESHITMTFGVAEFENDINSLDCINRADHAMYRGKQIGKNCVVC